MTSKQRALPNQDAYPPATTWGTWRVTKPSRIPVVLIVDEDLGFVWWLGQIFSQAGCQVVPTLNAGQMVSLTQDLNLKVDLIVVNPELSGVPEMIQDSEYVAAPQDRRHPQSQYGCWFARSMPTPRWNGLPVGGQFPRKSGWDVCEGL